MRFYHPSPVSNLYPGSSYAIDGWLSVASGDGLFSVQVLNTSGVAIFTSSLTGELGRWTSFSRVFTVQSASTDPVLQFQYIGTQAGLNYFDNVLIRDNKDMLSLGVLQIYPKWNLKKYNVNNKTDHRTKGGKLYSYKWGSYTKVEAELNYVQNSKASIINSWWSTDALIYFKVYSGGVWDVTTGYLMNDNAPFAERSEPYDQYKNGLIELESF